MNTNPPLNQYLTNIDHISIPLQPHHKLTIVEVTPPDDQITISIALQFCLNATVIASRKMEYYVIPLLLSRYKRALAQERDIEIKCAMIPRLPHFKLRLPLLACNYNHNCPYCENIDGMRFNRISRLQTLFTCSKCENQWFETVWIRNEVIVHILPQINSI